MQSQYYGLIIALIYLAIHVITLLAKESAKRKERERKRQAAEKERINGARVEQPATEPALNVDPMFSSRGRSGQPSLGSSKPWTPPTSPIPNRLDELAARRKEQLDALRARRDNRRIAQPQSGDAPSSRPSSQPDLFSRGQRTATTGGTQFEAQQARIDRDRREREATRKRHEKQARAQRQREAAKAQKAHASQQSPTRSDDIFKESEPIVPTATARVSPAVLSIRDRFRQSSSMRELFLLKEIIDRPMALRDL